jgi:hypothetical protein
VLNEIDTASLPRQARDKQINLRDILRVINGAFAAAADFETLKELKFD